MFTKQIYSQIDVLQKKLLATFVNRARRVNQSLSSSSRRMISLTSRRPPASRLTLLGLRLSNSWALSSFPLTLPGLLGITCLPFVGEPSEGASELLGAGAGISSHSPPEILSFLRKNGHSLISMSIDSLASAVDIGTGDDFTIAVTTSAVGNARRFLAGVDVPPVVGLENNLKIFVSNGLE